ncbi:MAG: cupin domain-containing protein [Caulobacteraceae bacterium]
MSESGELTAREIISLLDLAPHPEGGWYRQTFADVEIDGRPASTVIYFLLEAGQVSHWHRIDAVEAWLYHAGAPLTLRLAPLEGGHIDTIVLGPDLDEGQRPQAIVPKGWWQSAVSRGVFTLVTCTVAPGFRFEGFELAPPGWSPS